MPPKYPSTPHWPWSEKVHRDDSYHSDPEWFVGPEVIVTEKLDGGNTCLCNGEVYARSIQAPSNDGWMAMVKKHHTWKTEREDLCFYGEDLYGIHSIEYDALKEDETFRLFASRFFNPETEDNEKSWFSDWDLVEKHAKALNVKTVPVLFRGKFGSVKEITEFFKDNLASPSKLGPDCEGFVMRRPISFDSRDFAKNVCKYVRADHVQTDEHWRRNWQKCKIIGRKE